MASIDDDPGAAASRLEAALERIARVAHSTAAASGEQDAMVPAGLAARLDSLIARLRDELGDAAEGAGR